MVLSFFSFYTKQEEEFPSMSMGTCDHASSDPHTGRYHLIVGQQGK